MLSFWSLTFSFSFVRDFGSEFVLVNVRTSCPKTPQREAPSTLSVDQRTSETFDILGSQREIENYLGPSEVWFHMDNSLDPEDK